jgi:hypothetical protein
MSNSRAAIEVWEGTGPDAYTAVVHHLKLSIHRVETLQGATCSLSAHVDGNSGCCQTSCCSAALCGPGTNQMHMVYFAMCILRLVVMWMYQVQMHRAYVGLHACLHVLLQRSENCKVNASKWPDLSLSASVYKCFAGLVMTGDWSLGTASPGWLYGFWYIL